MNNDVAPSPDSAADSAGAAKTSDFPDAVGVATRTLSQDQLAGLNALASATGRIRPPRISIYDGDTSDHLRRKIKEDPPDILITNPDMLHAGILAYHADWSGFLSRLRFVVLDELHVYRGVFGAHVHHILRRLMRLAALYGAHPQFVAASATIGRPGEFAATLLGAPFRVVDNSGAPATGRDIVLVNPVTVSPYTAAVRVVAEAAREGARTIAFTKARRITERLHHGVGIGAQRTGDRADYYTVVLGEKETEILERIEERTLPIPGGGVPIGFGRLKVTVTIREYQKKRLFGGEAIANHPLEVPPLTYETTGLWIEIPRALPSLLTVDGLHFMGGIHAVVEEDRRAVELGMRRIRDAADVTAIGDGEEGEQSDHRVLDGVDPPHEVAPIRGET